MAQVEFADELIWQLQERDPRYHAKAYLVVLSALNHVMEHLSERRHISGAELAQGLRELALERFGVMSLTVLEYWGLRCTEDVGRIVFALVECGVLVKQEGDRIEDFRDVYDFREVFDEAYPWGMRLT